MRVLIVANDCEWASWSSKIAAIKAFYAPLLPLAIDLRYTDFQNVPLKEYPGIITTFVNGTAVDSNGTDIEVDQDWFRQNIVPITGGYDIAVFQLGNVASRVGLPLGIKFGKFGSTWCCETFVSSETSHYYLPNPSGVGMNDLGDLATVIIEHELSHALYAITGQPDRTHEFFYAGNLARVLTDIVLPDHGKLIMLYQQLVADLEAELGIIKGQSSAADMNIATSQFPPKIVAWALAIAHEEGATPELHNPGNLKYASLTASWGATRGREAADGGFLCQFPDDATGQKALCNFLVLGCENELIAFHAPEARTFEGFTKIYAGNPPQGYIDAIAKAIGVSLDAQISTFLS